MFLANGVSVIHNGSSPAQKLQALRPLALRVDGHARGFGKGGWAWCTCTRNRRNAGVFGRRCSAAS